MAGNNIESHMTDLKKELAKWGLFLVVTVLALGTVLTVWTAGFTDAGMTPPLLIPISITFLLVTVLVAFVFAMQRIERSGKMPHTYEDRYRRIFESSMDAIMILEPPSWAFTQCNPSTIRLFGAKDEAEFTSREPWTLSPERQPDGRLSSDKAKEMIETAMRNGSHFFEWTHRRLTGEDFPATVLLTRMEHGGTEFLQATVRDISREKLADEALVESEAKYRALVETTGMGFEIVDSRGRILDANKEYVRLSGHTELREILGRRISEWTADHARQSNLAAFEKCLKDGYLKNWDTEYVDSKGRITPVEINASARGEGESRRIMALCRDITERRQADEALHESEKRFRSLVEAAPEAIFVQSEGCMVYVNAASLTLFRAESQADLLGKPFMQHIAPEYMETVRDRIRFQRETGQAVPLMEMEYVRLDGSRVAVETAAVPISFQGKEAHLVFARDITERRLATDALRLSEEKFRNIFNNAQVGMFRTRLDGTEFLEINDKYLSILGRKREEILGKPSESFWADPKERAEMVRKLKMNGCVDGLECRFIRKDGKVINCIMSVRLYPGQGILEGSTIDVTERKHIDETLKETSERYHKLFEQVGDGIIIFDSHGQLISMNESFVKMHGFSAKEVLAMGIERLDVEGLTPFHDRVHRIMAGETLHFEVQHYHKDGHVFPISVSSNLISWGDKDVIVAVHRDITVRRQAEQLEMLAKQALEELNSSATAKDTVRNVLLLIKKTLNFDAVGLRLREGDDFPYFVQIGFPDDFVITENSLTVRDRDGVTCKDKDGNISLECMCGLVICGRTNPASPLFTPDGSFWTNNSRPLLDIPPDQDPRTNPRNLCMHKGYLSFALIPLRSGEEIIGLLQLSDHRPDRFTLSTIQYFERLGFSIAIALSRKKADEKIKSQLGELQRWNDAMNGRESRVLEIKREVNQMLARLGEPPRYPSVADK